MQLSARNRGILWAASCGAAIALSYQFADRRWATYAHDVLHHPHWAMLASKLGDAPAPLAGLGLLAVLAARMAGGSLTPAWRRLLAACIATLVTALAVIVLKHYFGRPWPETWVDNNPSWIRDHVFGFMPNHGGAGFQSFPSGHTARLAAPIAVVWRGLPRWRLPSLLPLVITTAGLLAADYHFVSDCIGGAYLGLLCATITLWVIPARG